MLGQVLKSFRIANPSGNVQVSLPSSGLAAGNYLITYRNGEGGVVETKKWLIIN
jgi:hypothetical protein